MKVCVPPLVRYVILRTESQLQVVGRDCSKVSLTPLATTATLLAFASLLSVSLQAIPPNARAGLQLLSNCIAAGNCLADPDSVAVLRAFGKAVVTALHAQEDWLAGWKDRKWQNKC